MNTVTWYSTFLRASLTLLDACAYSLLNNVYMLFYAVIATEPIPGSIITSFFNRIRLLLGIFIMFQLAMTVIKGIVNPETFTSDKTGGAHVISRIVISLMLLTLMVPIGIRSPKNEFERQIHNKGLLFGTLDSLQARILNNHVIENLVFGYNLDSENKLFSDNESDRYEGLKKYSNRLTSTIARTFYPINTKDPYGNPKDESQRVCEGYNINFVANNMPSWWLGSNFSVASFTSDTIYEMYYSEDTSAYYLLQMAIYSQCTVSENGGTKDYYAFDMNMVIIPGIVGFIMIWVILSLTFEVAVRSIKLAFLRLIAPIPIISYMNPSGSKDGAFNAWLKLLGTTYLELFLKLVVIYFVLNLSNEILSGTISFFILDSNEFLAGLVLIVILIALMIFAKEADKFIKQALGLKDNGGKFFSAMGKAMGIGASVISTPGNFMAGYRASKLADETRESFGEKDIFGNQVRANSAFNRAKHLLAGIYGGGAGIGVGSRAALEAKDHYLNASWDAMQKRNAAVLARGNDGSTLLGRLGSTISGAVMGEGRSGELERQVASMEARKKAMDAISSRVSGEMVKKDWTSGSADRGWRDTHGALLDGVLFNHKRFDAELEAAMAAGATTVVAHDVHGGAHTINTDDAKIMKGQILIANEDDYVKQAQKHSFTAANGQTYTDQYDSVLAAYIEDAIAKGGSGWDGTEFSVGTHGRINSRKDYKKTSDGLDAEILKAKRSNTIRKADDQHSKDKK